VSWKLKREQNSGDLHFITFSCHERRPYLATPKSRDLFLDALESVCQRHNCQILGYVVMPEHVHLLIAEPEAIPLATVLRALKVAVSKRSTQQPFWLKRYYDFNVYSEKKRIEKLNYMHRNPVVRGLVQQPEDWHWSSFQWYSTNKSRPVQVTGLPKTPDWGNS